MADTMTNIKNKIVAGASAVGKAIDKGPSIDLSKVERRVSSDWGSMKRDVKQDIKPVAKTYGKVASDVRQFGRDVRQDVQPFARTFGPAATKVAGDWRQFKGDVGQGSKFVGEHYAKPIASGIASGAKMAGSGIAAGAQHVASGAKIAGSGILSGAKMAGSGLASGAKMAGSGIATGARGVASAAKWGAGKAKEFANSTVFTGEYVPVVDDQGRYVRNEDGSVKMKKKPGALGEGGIFDRAGKRFAANVGAWNDAALEGIKKGVNINSGGQSGSSNPQLAYLMAQQRAQNAQQMFRRPQMGGQMMTRVTSPYGPNVTLMSQRRGEPSLGVSLMMPKRQVPMEMHNAFANQNNMVDIQRQRNMIKKNMLMESLSMPRRADKADQLHAMLRMGSSASNIKKRRL